MMLGKHQIQSWSTTQSVIAISSGEAEYYALVRAGSHALGVQAMLKDLGVSARIRIKTDASVAKSISNRKGLGKQRHIEVNQLWLQDKVRKGEIDIVKIPRDVNAADTMTQHRKAEEIRTHLEITNQEVEGGRHSLMPKIKENKITDEQQEEEG